MLPSVIRVCCASLFLLFETLELRLALLAAYTQIAWRLFVCLCRGLFSSLSLSFYLSLSFQCPVAKPDTVSSASTSSSSGFATCCYCYPSRDASVSAICPFFFFWCFPFSPSAWRSVWLRRRQLATAEAAERAPARTRPISPKARSEWEPLPLGKLLLLLLRSFSWRPP